MTAVLIAAAVFAVSFYILFSYADLSDGVIIRRIDGMIEQSGIKDKMPWIDGRKVFFITFAVLSAVTLKFVMSGFAQGILIVVVFIFVMYELSKIYLEKKSKRIGSEYINFLNMYSNFFNTYDSCPIALREAGKYAGKPLSDVINRYMPLYERSSKSFDEVLMMMGDAVDDDEFKKFISFTRMYNMYGGDYNEILNRLRDQALKNSQLRKERESSGTTAILVIGATILLSLLSFVGLTPNDMYMLTHTVTGWVILGFNIFSYLFGLYMIKNILKS